MADEPAGTFTDAAGREFATPVPNQKADDSPYTPPAPPAPPAPPPEQPAA